MLKIRLERVGRKNDPSFRVVLTESKNAAKSGKFLKVLGHYDSRKDTIRLEGEEIKSWISKGAQVSDTMHNLLISNKILEGKKKNVLPRKRPITKEPTTNDLQQTTQSEQIATNEAETQSESQPESAEEEAKAQESPVAKISSQESLVPVPEEREASEGEEKT
ncbi:MAG: 30S ribosomal protein S16 [Candidatus Zambryskibacteria bacterium RIFCSPHIGHO2_01_FULL_43_25]|uniref:Small ribosomal subunit protein bS16 n=1 Tax=Candidatus Zambryskibacteria bacterium RIFCSPLOWO2_01_FULL_45_21 TaxID=1802761 RepID=A0A1G2U5M5_9BACT|nr:MAG: 30S ribosomal protein S16 [Candidatus Zambryskibacteria bacterium RIFCSPHIGHO2_01_FULL_43_25]OHB00387.1 MAG: 30S ribosomal protein S16 [Candidatus Zambryskibacteria bacterium RIFCSPHIGHO2_12_FULL_44_12b]OHB04182.1 MAG: 30S ribosomal protein S16 [Candidatus Zambryskibacteria bacterium RIFCSPLOWO2_01_FULL_45_21]